MKKFLTLIILVGVFLLRISGVKAYAVTMSREYIDNVWSFHYRDGDMWTFGNLPYNYADGKLVYCIQPDARINIDTYYTYDDFSISGYTEDEKRQMELISYYGYGFPGHESLRYYMATQELIWLFSPDEYITWNTSKNEDGEVIDVSAEKNEIMRLVNNHNKVPSFYNYGFNTETDYIIAFDSNNALDKYRIEVPEGVSYEMINNSKIKFTSNKIGPYKVYFKKKRVVNENTLVYNNDSLRTQKLAVFKGPDINEFSINLYFNGSYVEIDKKDIETNELISDSNTIIKIKNLNTGNYVNDKEYTLHNGYNWLYLPVGKYKIEEIIAPKDYYLDEEGITFELSVGSDTRNYITLFNKKIKGKININKIDEEDKNLEGVKFEIYDEEDNLVDEITTTSSITSSKELPLGKYKVKEVNTLYGYEKNDEIYEVELKYKDQNTKIVNEDIDIINKKIKCEIVLITKSKDLMLDAKFGIYDKNNNLILSDYTINGKKEIYLPYGEYILKELEVPDGYKINNKEISFSVNDITCASSFEFDNDKIIMPDTFTKNNSIFLIILLINITSYAYYKKNC